MAAGIPAEDTLVEEAEVVEAEDINRDIVVAVDTVGEGDKGIGVGILSNRCRCNNPSIWVIWASICRLVPPVYCLRG